MEAGQGDGREARKWKLIAGAAGATLVLALIALAFVLGMGAGGDDTSATTDAQGPAPEATDTAAEETDTTDATDTTDTDTDTEDTDGEVLEETTPSRLRTPGAQTGAPRIVGQVTLKPVEALAGKGDAGSAAIALTGGELQVVIRARLPRSARDEAYEVWLYNSDEDALSLGAQVADDRGRFAGVTPLPEGDENEKYMFIDISREPVDGPKAHSGKSVLRGDFSKFTRDRGAN